MLHCFDGGGVRVTAVAAGAAGALGNSAMKQVPENRETSAGKHGFWSVWSCYGVLEEFPAREVSDFFDSSGL